MFLLQVRVGRHGGAIRSTVVRENGVRSATYTSGIVMVVGRHLFLREEPLQMGPLRLGSVARNILRGGGSPTLKQVKEEFKLLAHGTRTRSGSGSRGIRTRSGRGSIQNGRKRLERLQYSYTYFLRNSAWKRNRHTAFAHRPDKYIIP